MFQDKRELLFLLERTKEDLEDLELYVNDLFNFLPISICSVTPLGIIININPAFKELTGYHEIEIIGEEMEVLFPPKAGQDLWQQILKEKTIKEKEVVLLTKEKKEVQVNVSATIRKDLEENEIGFFLTFHDITELKKLQEELEEKVRERTADLQKKMKELESMQRLFVGRELKMVELKKEIEKIKKGKKE